MGGKGGKLPGPCSVGGAPRSLRMIFLSPFTGNKLPVAGGSRVNECKGKSSYFVNRKNTVTISR